MSSRRERLARAILAGGPGARRVGDPATSAPQILGLSFPGLEGDALVTQLDHPRWIHVLPNGDVLVAESRANKAVRRMFALAKRYRSRIKRLYIYNWQQPVGRNRFDAGLVTNKNKPRPAYRTVKKTLRGSAFNP